MSQEIKQRKLGILRALMIVNFLKARNIKEPIKIIALAHDNLFLVREHYKLATQSNYPKGGVIVGDNKEPEIILR